MDYLSRDIERFDVLGVPISATSIERAAAVVLKWAQDGIGRMVFIRDVHGVVQAYDNPRLLALHHKASMVSPDGMPLVWIGKVRGYDVDRTSGPDFMPYLMEQSVGFGLKHYLYGGKIGIAEKLRHEFERRFPGVDIVRTETPPFRELTDDEVAEVAANIRAAGAQVVWIGISTPKQEFLMERLRPLVSATLIGVGAAFDYHSGAIKRAPKWMQRSGLEWSHRLASEPRRLWRRYVILAPRFLYLVATEKMRRGRP